MRAIGLAGTEAAGLKSAFGTMAKPLHAGRAASAGLLAALLAGGGFTAAADVLETKQGFAETHAGTVPGPSALEGLSGRFLIRETLFKYHAACYLTHAAIEAARRLREAHAVDPQAIEAVAVTVAPSLLGVCNIAEPRTGLVGKFSLRATTALALLGEDTGAVATYSDAKMAETSVVRLRDRVRVEVDRAFSPTRARVTVVAGGRRLEEEADTGVPAADLAAQRRRLRAKFDALAGSVLGPRQVGDLAEMALGVDRLLGPAVRCRRLLVARRPRRRPPRRAPGRDPGRARAGGGLPHALARALARRALPLPRRSRRARLDLHRSPAEQLRRGALVRAPARPGARHRHRRHLGGRDRVRAARRTPRHGLRLATGVCRARRAGGPDRPPSGAALHAPRSRRPGPPARRTRRRRPRLARRPGARGARDRALRPARGGIPASQLLAHGGGVQPHHGGPRLGAALPDAAPRGPRAPRVGRLARPRRDRGHGRGGPARLRRAARPLRPATRGRRVLLSAERRRPPPLDDAQHAAARLLCRPLRLCDGRQCDAVREPQRGGLRPPPLRGDRGPHEPLPGARAGDRRARNRLPPRPHGELRARARDGHGGEPPRRRHRPPRT